VLSYSNIPVSKIPVTSNSSYVGIGVPVTALILTPALPTSVIFWPGQTLSWLASVLPSTAPRCRPSALAKRKSPCTACDRIDVGSATPGACGSMPTIWAAVVNP
jgi:hypothetical protein